MEEKIEHFSTLPDYLLTMSQATRVLGFKDYRVMEVMCESGFIKPLKVAGSKRLRFRYQDVMKLATPIPHLSKERNTETRIFKFMVNLKDSKDQPSVNPKMQDQYLSFVDAIQYLGSGNHNRISKLVRDGHLQAYQIPTVSKLRVLKSEVCSLAVPQLSSKQN